MLDFSDKPYRYFPSRRIEPIARTIQWVNRLWYLPRRLKIQGVKVTGGSSLLQQRRGSDRLLFLPNHPSHCDPQIYLESITRLAVTTQMMGAYDVFLRGRIAAWVMQLLGVFSVDREGSDPRAMQQATSVMREGRYALTIFPEGNVYLQNDVVTPFHDGAAMLGLRAQKEFGEHGPRLLAVPVSIKLTHLTDAREPTIATLRRVAEVVGAEITGDEPREMLATVGKAALTRNLKHRGIEIDDHATMTAMIDASADAVLCDLERKMDLKTRAGDSVIERVRKARRAIHQVRLDEARLADHAAAAVWADQAMLAFRIASYGGAYVAEHPTLDRISETAEKLAEDVFGVIQPRVVPRTALVHFGEPIDMSQRLETFLQSARQAVRGLTEDVERAVQAGLDELNASNPHIGGEHWSSLGTAPQA